jgi:hypothetical protein
MAGPSRTQTRPGNSIASWLKTCGLLGCALSIKVPSLHATDRRRRCVAAAGHDHEAHAAVGEIEVACFAALPPKSPRPQRRTSGALGRRDTPPPSGMEKAKAFQHTVCRWIHKQTWCCMSNVVRSIWIVGTHMCPEAMASLLEQRRLEASAVGGHGHCVNAEGAAVRRHRRIAAAWGGDAAGLRYSFALQVRAKARRSDARRPEAQLLSTHSSDLKAKGTKRTPCVGAGKPSPGMAPG